MSDKDSLKIFKVHGTCTLCMNYFDMPKVLDCGHSFCNNCIFVYWRDYLSTSSCPQCKKIVEAKNLRLNRGLEDFAKSFKQREADLTSDKERVCEKHWCPLISFCKVDRAPLCPVCVEAEEHQTHDMVPLEQAAQELRVYFLICIDNIRSRTELVLSQKMKTDTEGVDLFKSAQMAKEQMAAKFNDLRKFLMHREHFVMCKIKDTALEIVEKRNKSMDSIFREISFHQKLVRDLQEKCCQPPTELVQDVGSMIERYERTSVAPCQGPFSFKQRWQLWDLQDLNAFLDCAIKQFKTCLEYQILLQEALVTLDAQTAHSRLLLSNDFRSVSLEDDLQERPEHPILFDPTLSVLGREGFSTGRHYWDVLVGSKGNWAVGVAKKSVKYNAPLANHTRGGIYAFGKLNGQYCFFGYHRYSCVDYKGELRRVRVCLNCLRGYVAFFDCDGGGLIYQTAIPAIKGMAFPFFQVSNKAVLTLGS